jgi:hypothetical protein
LLKQKTAKAKQINNPHKPNIFFSLPPLKTKDYGAATAKQQIAQAQQSPTKQLTARAQKNISPVATAPTKTRKSPNKGNSKSKTTTKGMLCWSVKIFPLSPPSTQKTADPTGDPESKRRIAEPEGEI